MGFAFLIVAILLSAPAWAHLYVEPYVGYLESLKNSSLTTWGTTTEAKDNVHGII